MNRLFLALWPDAALARDLAAGLPPELGGARPLALADLHVTLCFLGAVDEAATAALVARAADTAARSFELHFTRIESWRRARVVVALADEVPEPARALAAGLATQARALGLTPDEKPLRPHVTLARGGASAGFPESVQASAAWRPLHWRPRSFHLAQSQQLGEQRSGAGAALRYRLLASWPLAD